MKDLTKLAGTPGEQFNQGASMSAGNTVTEPAWGAGPGSAPVNPPPKVGHPHDEPQMEIPANKDLTHLVSANAVTKSPANWKKV